jgi:hypothetical protein
MGDYPANKMDYEIDIGLKAASTVSESSIMVDL